MRSSETLLFIVKPDDVTSGVGTFVGMISPRFVSVLELDEPLEFPPLGFSMLRMSRAALR